MIESHADNSTMHIGHFAQNEQVAKKDFTLQNISSCKNTHKAPAFSCVSYHGNALTPATIYQALTIKASLFSHFYGKSNSQHAALMCEKWKTTDLESVLVIQHILSMGMSDQEIAKLSPDKILLHCYRKKEGLNPQDPTLINTQYSGIFIQKTHSEDISYCEKFGGRVNSSQMYARKLINGCIHFLVSVINNPGQNPYDSQGAIEVGCKFSDVLLLKGKVHLEIDTSICNSVVVELPKDARLPYTVLDRSSAGNRLSSQ